MTSPSNVPAPSSVASMIRVFDEPTSERGRRLGDLLGIEPRSRATKPFPLVRVVVRARVVGDCSITELEEHYANPYRKPLDVVHTIPLPADGAVTAFELRAGERCVRGQCKRREEAREAFNNAKARGKTAAIIESERDDLHTISLANVPRGAAVVVKMTVVERLRVDDGRFEYRLPTTISQKYVPGTARAHEGQGIAADTDRAPDASRLTPPVMIGGGTELDFEIELPADSTDISANTPLSRVDPGAAAIVLRPIATATCDRDIVVRSWTRTEQPVARAYSDGERTLVVVDPPASRRPELESPREAVFVLDRSGSMQGTRLNAAKRALTATLRALTPKDTFEIIAFDNQTQTFASAPAPATDTNIARAIEFLTKIRAEGGTEALPALELACVKRVETGRVRTVLFLTDGDVANDGELIALSRRLDPATRLFTIGLGVSPAASLLSKLARLCGGTHLYLQDSDDIEAEIRRFSAALAGPMACGLAEVGARRATPCDLFAGRSATFFLDGHREQVAVVSTDGRFSATCSVAKSPVALGALWARDRVQALEDRRVAHPTDAALIDSEIASLGVAHQIQTRLTSFVAIDESSQEEGEAIEIVQPVDAVADREDAADLALCCYQMSAPPTESIREEKILSEDDAVDEAVDGLGSQSNARGVGMGSSPRQSRRSLLSRVFRSVKPAGSQDLMPAALRFVRRSEELVDSVPAEDWNSLDAWTLRNAAAILLALTITGVPEHDPRVRTIEAVLRALIGSQADGFFSQIRKDIAAKKIVEAFERTYTIAGAGDLIDFANLSIGTSHDE